MNAHYLEMHPGQSALSSANRQAWPPVAVGRTTPSHPLSRLRSACSVSLPMSGRGSRCGGKILWRSLLDLCWRKPAADSTVPAFALLQCCSSQARNEMPMVLVTAVTLRRPRMYCVRTISSARQAGIQTVPAVRAACENPGSWESAVRPCETQKSFQRTSITQSAAGDR